MKKMIFVILSISMLFVSSFSVKANNTIDYEELFDNHQSIMLIINPNLGTIYYANQAAVSFYGYPLDILIGMSIDMINTLSPAEIDEEIQKATLEQRNFFIFKHRLANGEIRIVHVYSYPTEINGETYLFSIVIDQTEAAAIERRNQIYMTTVFMLMVVLIIVTTVLFSKVNRRNHQIEESHKTITEQERMKSTLLSNLPGIAYRCLNDKKWTMLFISDKIIELADYEPNDFCTGLITYYDLIHPDDVIKVSQTFQNALTQGIQAELIYRIVTKSKALKWVSEKAQYIGQKNDQGVEIIEGFIEDITSEKLADLQADYYKDLLQYIITSSNQGIAVHDKHMNYIYVSERYKEHFRVKEDIIGKNHYDVFPDLPENWHQVHQRVLKGEVLSADRDPFLHSDGSIDYTRWLCRPWYDENAEIGGIIVYTEVINDLIQAELSAQRTRDNLQLVMDNLPIGIAVNSIIPEVEFSYMNDYFPDIYGTTREALSVSDSFWHVVYEDSEFREHMKQTIISGLQSGDPKRMRWEDIPIMKNGEIVKYITAQGVRIPDSKYIISMVIDVTEQKRKEKQIIYTSNHDYLTNLPNRRYFEEMLTKLDHPDYYPLSIAMIDVNGLKIINDAFGHEKGNEALIMVSTFLKNNKRENDFVARIGGDEFVILRPQTSFDETEELKLSMMGESQLMTLDDLKVSLSIGYAVKEHVEEDTQIILKDAEDNMYRNKILHGQSARNESVMAIFNALKDKYEEERVHSDKVSQYCKMMGQNLGLTSDEIKELELAGLMHDIGKITIPDKILDKPGKLTDEEWKVMKNHTINGYNILRSADKYSRLAEYALTHHERYDGKGYPNGLKGNDIPLFSRIISICDSFEAMTSDRPYRKALGIDYAVEELKRCSGSQFDEELVKQFVHMINQQ